MGLSSDSLIHFTKNKTSLKGILSGDLKMKYCYEKICTTDYDYTLAVPMISFCDIPLSEIKEHINKYGSYGIGLTKKWATENGLNPILYIEKNSILGNHTLDILYDQVLENKDIDKLTEPELALADIFRYTKNYESELIRDSKVINKNYRFSDEREWRFCPEKDILKKNPYLIVNAEDYLANKSKFNKPLSALRLNFTPDDISYIIIKSENEISEFIRFLEDTKGKKYTLEQVRRLTTRIITCERIKSDF